MNYIDVYKRRISHLGTTPQEKAFQSGILEFRRYLKYNEHTVHGLFNEDTGAPFSGVILTDKEDENRVSQILLVELDTTITTGNLILWNDEHWLVYRKTTSSYQPYQKFYMVRCNHFIRWVDSDGSVKESWAYLVGSKDSKIKDNFRTWNNMITPQPNKYIELILPHTTMMVNTEIIVLGEGWYLVDYDQNSVPGVVFMSFTESNINLQRDDVPNILANSDSVAKWTISGAASQTVIPGEEVIVQCYIYKNGQIVEVDSAELTYAVSGHLYRRDGKIFSTALGEQGTITVSYKGATFTQQIIISGQESAQIVLVGNDKVRAGQVATYTLEGAQETTFTVSDIKLATIKKVDLNTCIVQANGANKLGCVDLIAEYNGQEYAKTIQIVSLWQVI